MYTEIKKTIEALGTKSIPEERKAILQQIIDYLQHKLELQEPLTLLFICTHNSRRSILAEIWANTMAAHYQIPNVHIFSCGTEVTGVHQQIIHTLREECFKIETDEEAPNPIYSIAFSEDHAPIETRSIMFEDTLLQDKTFAAVMVCSTASDSCPYITGTEKRIALPYEDPKAFDEHPDKQHAYLHTSKEIAREMKYIFSKLKVS